MTAVQWGVFARCFPTQGAAELAATIRDHAFEVVQLNLSAVGKPTIPSETELAAIDFPEIAAAFHDASLGLWGLSASFNIIHPAPGVADQQASDAARLIRRAPELGVTAVTLCTGSRDANDMWRAHPDNASEAAWADLLRRLDPLLDAAEAADVLLAVEPEPGNVISGTDAAVRLVDELGARARHIGFILDPANLVGESAPEEFEAVLQDAFDRLGEQTICLHAKDVVSWDERLAGGAGLNFGLVRELHAALPHRVPIIIQDANPENIRAVRDLVEHGA